MNVWKALFNTEQLQVVGHLLHSYQGRLPGGGSHFLSFRSSLLCLLPTLHSDFSCQPRSFLMNEEAAACWLFPLAGKSLLYQLATGLGRGLLAPGTSANSEKADGVMVTGVLDVSL